MKYQVRWTPRPGFSSLAQPGDAGLKHLGFGLLSLAQGEKHALIPGARETALVLLKGTVAISGGGLSRQVIGPRKDLFGDRPWTVMLPAQSGCDIEAIDDAEVAVCQAPSSLRGEARVIPPDKVKEVTLGKANWTRRALMMVDENVPAELLFIGEAIVPSGNWASFPPHRHERDALPSEVEMEEIYHFRFDRPKGFGIQKIYTDDGSIDETITVRERDTILIPRGYHPVVTAPGYSMYYLWIMAGQNRRFLSSIDPDHRWILQA
ncbi:MAG TPA: 5-deoxy-glucuronate isomerase [Verrucomicrobiae bacterium]|nr:5-deoxy-glucuronate isomerase [Verrucomicrobiae bacterium]